MKRGEIRLKVEEEIDWIERNEKTRSKEKNMCWRPSEKRKKLDEEWK